MYDELTQVDIDKMQEELTRRIQVTRPELIEQVQIARGFGDLSENYEYKAAKLEKNRNESRIRYLERMIRTAKVIDPASDAEAVGLFDFVTVELEELGKTMTIELSTTLRQDALKNVISKESPLGKAIIGKKAGERVYVSLSQDSGYHAKILSFTKGKDDESLPIGRF